MKLYEPWEVERAKYRFTLIIATFGAIAIMYSFVGVALSLLSS